MKSYDIIGYVYKADTYCPACTVSEVRVDYNINTLYTGNEEKQLRQMAWDLGIEYDDEYSYDSDNFPKVIFADQNEDDYCGSCHEPLIGD